MRQLFATLLLMFLLSSAGLAQTSSNPPATSPTQDSTSQQSQPRSEPAPSDATTQPAAAPAQPESKKESAAKRKLKDLAPNCIDIFAIHKCWATPPADEPKTSTKTGLDPEYAKDMDVGDFYLTERKNYPGAMMRFRDALEHKPNDPAATFKLAQSLEGLHQSDEARQRFQEYLKLEPQGPFANDAKKALDRLQSKDASQNSAKKPPR